MAIKASIAFMLLRLLIAKWHRVTMYVTIAIFEAFSFAFFFLFIFQCMPPTYFWTRITNTEGSCLNYTVVTNMVYAYSSLICVGDWAFCFLPMYIVWQLELVSKKEKLMIGIILAMSAM